MSVFIPLLLLVATIWLLRFVSQHAKRLEFKKHSPLWIAAIWAVSIAVTLLFRHYYELPIIVYILFSTAIATVTYLVLADIDIVAALSFSTSNTLVLLAVMFYFGMLGNNLDKTVTSGDVQLVADAVCQCGASQFCLDKALPQMEKTVVAAQALVGNDAIIVANAVARAHQCMQENPVKRETLVTFLDEWEQEQESDKVRKLKSMTATNNTASANTPTKSIEFQAVTVATLKNYTGDLLRLTKDNGKVLNGWLIADEGKNIILKQEFSDGYVHTPIAKTSITLFEVKSP